MRLEIPRYEQTSGRGWESKVPYYWLEKEYPSEAENEKRNSLRQKEEEGEEEDEEEEEENVFSTVHSPSTLINHASWGIAPASGPIHSFLAISQYRTQARAMNSPDSCFVPVLSDQSRHSQDSSPLLCGHHCPPSV